MRIRKLTLIGDGPTDEALIPIISWSMVFLEYVAPFSLTFARELSGPRALRERVEAVRVLYPCDLLLIHRDAERESRQFRVAEIEEATQDLVPLHVPIIPIRMTEAWLLGCEAAIRKAAENPNGAEGLEIPPKHRWEAEPDPKSILERALEVASGLNARRRRKFSVTRAKKRVAPQTSNFEHLRGLASFEAFLSSFRDGLRLLDQTIAQ